MDQEDQIQCVIDMTARAARLVIEEIRRGDLDGMAVDAEMLRRRVTWALNVLLHPGGQCPCDQCRLIGEKEAAAGRSEERG